MKSKMPEGGTVMAFMQWKDSYSVNIREIDEQHKKLVGLINDLFDAMTQGHGKEVLGKVIQGLVDYTVFHFGTEERLFQAHGYPETAQHKAEHERFTQKVLEFKKGFDAGTALLTKDILKFLSDWLNGHILVVDKKYGPYLNSKGVV